MKVPGQSVGRIVMSFKPLLDWMCSMVGFIQVAGSVLSVVWIVFSSKLSFTQDLKCSHLIVMIYLLVSVIKIDWFLWLIMVLFSTQLDVPLAVPLGSRVTTVHGRLLVYHVLT